MVRSKRKLNYKKVFLFLLILIILTLVIIKIFSSKNSKTELENNTNKEITINLKGSGEINLYLGEEYNELGYSAVDIEGTDYSEQVTVSSQLDINKPGTYEITYILNNNFNIQAKRIVVVKQSRLLKDGEKSKNSLPVLMYHYFYDESKGETGKNSNYMEISDFENQLKYLKENNFYYPTWKEVEDFVNKKIDLPKNSVVITMDDGHNSLYNLAIPMLNKYQIPATAFIITTKFDQKNLEKYKDSTVNFQSHSDNMHRAGGNIGHGGIFTALSVEEGIEDLKLSIEKLGGNGDALAYPYGDYTEKTKEAAKKAGFKVAFTTEYDKVSPGMDKYSLPRVRMFKDITIQGFAGSL